MTVYMWGSWLIICVKWPILIWAVTDLYKTSATTYGPAHERTMCHSYVRHDPFRYEPWLTLTDVCCDSWPSTNLTKGSVRSIKPALSGKFAILWTLTLRMLAANARYMVPWLLLVFLCAMTRFTHETWLMSHMWHDACHTCDMTHFKLSANARYMVPWLFVVFLCGVTRFIHVAWRISHVWHDAFHTCDMTFFKLSANVRYMVPWLLLLFLCAVTRFIREIWLISHMWHDSFQTVCEREIYGALALVAFPVCRDSFHTCGMTHFTRVTWLISKCPRTRNTWCLGSCCFSCVVWHISYVWHDSFQRVCERKMYGALFFCVSMGAFIRVTWLIHVCGATYSCVWRNSTHIRVCSPGFVTWRIHACEMTHSCAWWDSLTCATWLIGVCEVTHADAC